MANVMSKHRNVGYRVSADIFIEPGLEKSITLVEDVTVFPSTTIDGDETPIEFPINSNNLHYINLYDSELILQVSLKDKYGAADVVLGCVNNLMGSLFSNVEILWNDIAVGANSSYYPYKSLDKNLLSVGGKDINALNTSLFTKDSTLGTITITNLALKARAEKIKTTCGIHLIGKLRHPILEVNQLIPNLVSVKIRLRRNVKDFFLLGASTLSSSDYTFSIDSTKFRYKRILLDDELTARHQKMFNQNRPAIFPIEDTEIKAFNIPAQSVNAISPVLYSGRLPSVIIVALTKSTAFNGSLSENPFNFEKFNVQNITLQIQSDTVSSKSVDVDFRNSCLHLYRTFEKELNVNAEGYFSETEFKDGHCFYIFHLYPKAVKGFNSVPKFGTIRCEIRLSEAPTSPLNVLLFSEIENTLLVDKFGRVSEKYE